VASGTLAGVTRRTTIEPARQAGQPVQQGRLSAGDLRRAAAEVLITSTADGVIPATVIDGKPDDRALLHGDSSDNLPGLRHPRQRLARLSSMF
jgi:branched-subunit amino acid aminotransferase/4-amino-4-deoxychorismate lyase